MLTIPGQVNGPKLAFNAISTDTAVSQDLGVIGRDNQNRIRWGNLLTLPVGQGGLLYVAPVYASPGASDAASSYPRLIRVAMMYNDKVGYGPDGEHGARRHLRRRRRSHRDRSGPGDRARRQPTAGARRRRPRRPPAPAVSPRCRPRRSRRCRRAGMTGTVAGQGRRAAGGRVGAGGGAGRPAQRQLRRVRRGAAAPRRRDEQVYTAK